MTYINIPHVHSDKGQICSKQTQLSSSTAEYNEEKQPEKIALVVKLKLAARKLFHNPAG